MPKLRAAMHLDTVFTFADRDCVLLYPDIVYSIHAYLLPAEQPAERRRAAQGREGRSYGPVDRPDWTQNDPSRLPSTITPTSAISAPTIATMTMSK